MIAALVRKEILNNLLNLRFALAYFLATVLLVGSCAILISDYNAQRKLRTVNESVIQRQLESFSNGKPWQYMTRRTVVREPLVTSIFSQGSEKDADQQATMSPNFSPRFYGEFRRNPSANLFPTIDLTFIIGIIFSLLIFVLTFDAVAGERESGTLKVLLAGPVSRASFICAKWLGTFITIMIPCLTAWVASCLLLVIHPGITVTAADWLRILGIFGASTLFLATIISMAIMVSTLFRHGTTVLLALLLGWVVLIVAVPSLSGPIAVLISRPALSQEVDIRSQRVAVSLDTNGIKLDPAINDLPHKALAGRNYDSLPDVEQHRIDSLFGESSWYRDLLRIDKNNELEQQHANHLAATEQLARWIARISPFGCYKHASVAMAGTGIAREKELLDAVLRYNKTVYLYKNTFDRAGILPQEYGPVMTVRRTSLASAAQEALPDAGIMALMAVLFFMIAFVAFVRKEAL